jgi:hypothetical protein
VIIDSFVLCNPPERKARSHCIPIKKSHTGDTKKIQITNVLEIRDLQHQVQKTGMTAAQSPSIHQGLVRGKSFGIRLGYGLKKLKINPGVDVSGKFEAGGGY